MTSGVPWPDRIETASLKFSNTRLAGTMVIEPECISDQRGFFARVWCAQEFANYGLSDSFVQCSVSFNSRKGTLRGLHYQLRPYEEVKLVRCTAGAIHDVVVDLRADSPTYLQHIAVELTQDNRKILYIPEGCAHGFQTLADSTEVHYQMSEIYHPERSAGHRWNDPAFGIDWPIKVSVISKRDSSYADFSPAAHNT